MRKFALLALGVVAVLGIALTVAPTATAAIENSAHDFSGAGWNSGGEICAPCHTPHNADQTANLGAPLWDHDVTTQTFTLYSSTTMNATDLGQPSGVSKLCLSCHDGSVALDSFGGATGTTTIDTIGTGSGDFGTDLRYHHPVGFTYNTALATADGGLYDPATTTAVSNLLFSGKLECGSCHDVHDAGQDSLLVMSNASSALCLTCHNK